MDEWGSENKSQCRRKTVRKETVLRALHFRVKSGRREFAKNRRERMKVSGKGSDKISAEGGQKTEDGHHSLQN